MNNLPTSKLRFFIIGSGAIGTYVGGSLARIGHKVVFLERPQRVNILQETGISLTVEGQTHRITQPVVVGSLRDAFDKNAYDAAIFALKSYHTQAMAARLETFRECVPPLLCLQNGIGNEEILAKAVGGKNVIPGTITTSVTKNHTGDISVRKKRGMGLAADSPGISQLVDAFQDAGLEPMVYNNPSSMKWTKLLTNLMANASCAILDMTPGEVYSDLELYSMEIRQLREALAVMRARHIPPVNLPGIPSKLLARVVRNIPPTLSQPLLSRIIRGGRGGKMPSLHMDLHAGKEKNEVIYLNGAVVREGKKLGVPTPVNALLNRTLLGLATGELSIENYARQPQRFLSQLDPN